jgi:Holliday junction resolvase RusA-like endonuclease
MLTDQELETLLRHNYTSTLVGKHNETEDSIWIVFPFKPLSINAYWGNGLKRQRYVTKEGKKFKKKILDCIHVLFGEEIPKILGPVELSFCFGLKRDQDLDNLLKVVIDAMKNVLFEDDKEIFQLRVMKMRGAPTSGFTVRIQSIPPEIFNSLYLFEDASHKKKKRKRE